MSKVTHGSCPLLCADVFCFPPPQCVIAPTPRQIKTLWISLGEVGTMQMSVLSKGDSLTASVSLPMTLRWRVVVVFQCPLDYRRLKGWSCDFLPLGFYLLWWNRRFHQLLNAVTMNRMLLQHVCIVLGGSAYYPIRLNIPVSSQDYLAAEVFVFWATKPKAALFDRHKNGRQSASSEKKPIQLWFDGSQNSQHFLYVFHRGTRVTFRLSSPGRAGRVRRASSRRDRVTLIAAYVSVPVCLHPHKVPH